MTALHRKADAHKDEAARNGELLSNAQVRHDALLDLWAAAAMRRNDAGADARQMTTADIADPDGIFARLNRDFDTSVVTLDDEIRNRMTTMLKGVAREMAGSR